MQNDTARYETLLVTDEGPVRRILINRPGALNALNTAVRRELMDAVVRASEDAAVRVVVLGGAGTAAFAAGADIKEMLECSPAQAEAISHDAKRLHGAIREASKPVIACIYGHCLGGGFELALACDIRVAADTAKFGLPEIRLGILPGGGGTVRLTRIAGPGWARRLTMTGDTISAAQALSIGIVTDVAPADDMAALTARLAEKLAGLSPAAVRQLKQTLNAVGECGLDAAESLEGRSFGACFAHPDQREGMTAFLEKRKPRFGAA